MGMRNTWRGQKQGCQRSVFKRVVNVIDELCQLMFDDEQILVLIHQATMLEHNPQFHYIKDPKEGQVEQILNEMEIQRDPKKRNGRGLIFGLLVVILLSGGILKCNIIKKNNFLYGLNNRNTIFEGLIDQVPVRMRMYREDNIIYADFVTLGNTEEVALKGLYYPISGHITLKNKEKGISMSLYINKKENDAYIGKMQQHGESSNISIYLRHAYAEMFPGDVERNTMYQTLGYDTQKVDEKVNIFLRYVKENQRELVAELILYPLTVTTNEKILIIGNKKEFVENYDKIIDKTILHEVENEFSAFWMVDSDYIGIINGRVRLCKTTDNEIKITAISNKTNY